MRARPGVTLKLSRARHLNFLIEADDVHYGVGGQFPGALLQIYQRQPESCVASLFIVSRSCTDPSMRHIISEYSDNLRRFLLTEEKHDGFVGLVTSGVIF